MSYNFSMKTKAIYTFLILLFLVSCGKNDTASQGAASGSVVPGSVDVPQEQPQVMVSSIVSNTETCTANTVCSLTTLATDDVVLAVEVVNEDVGSNCVENVSFTVLDTNEIVTTENCSGEFALTYTDSTSLTQDMQLIELTDFTVDSGLSDISGLTEGDIIAEELNQGILNWDNCISPEDSTNGFVVAVEEGSRLISFPSINGFMNSNKINNANFYAVSGSNEILQKLGFDPIKKTAYLHNEENIYFVVVEFEGPISCSKIKWSNFKVETVSSSIY
jgi:hypothetical protein